MKDLVKIMLVLALVFASTFVIIKSTGILNIGNIKQTLIYAQQVHPAYIVAIVVGLLFADLFIAIPTMTVSILSGFFLGWPMGIATSLIGFYLAGITGYAISRIYGYRLLNHIYNDQQRLNEIHKNFSEYGPVILIICRAMPILPEVSCCMAGATRMSFYRFILMYSIGTIPYTLIITYAGSISSLENPTPAILGAIGVSLVLWVSWYIFATKMRKK